MSTILYTDRQFAEDLPRQLVVPASAGSGKTTELTRQLIQLLLSEAIPQSDLPNILAVTFTNNAALEMKQRVLSTLKKIHFGVSSEEADFTFLLPENAPRIRHDAGLLVDRLLERYSEFHVQTIDSFLARVFKSLALEFGFSPDFSIRLSSDTLIDEAFEAVTRAIGTHRGYLPLFENLVDLILESGRLDGKYIWNPYEDLSREVKLLYVKLVQHAAPVIVRDYSKEIRSDETELIASVLELERRIGQSGLKPKSGFERYAGEARGGKHERLLELTFPNPPVAKTGSKPADYERFVEEHQTLAERIVVLRRGLLALHARQRYLPYAQALVALSGAIETARRHRGEVDIGEVSRRLAGFLDSEAIPDLYLKLGEEIRHYLIDEFQDTSPVQWHVFRPLIANALSEGGSLFVVGDLKQSIYSFRGADWRIMDELIHRNPFPMAGAPDVKPLEINYRSGEQIVDFTREIFHSIVPTVVTDGAENASGLASYRQDPTPELRTKGYVETIFVERDDDTHPERAELEARVLECVRRGYHLRDIAILTPTNDAVIAVSAWLNEKEIEFISHSSLDIRSRKVTAELIAMLRFLDSPVDDLAFATVAFGELLAGCLRQDRGAASVDDVHSFLRRRLTAQQSSQPLYASFREHFGELWHRYFEEAFTHVGYLPLYDLVSEICTTLRVFDVMPEEEATFVKLLEVAQEFEEMGMNTVRDFLRYADEESEDADWTMSLPKDANAVQIMTVHKAKGLGFPVVIALFYDSRPRTNPVALIEEEGGVTLLHATKDLKEVPELAETYNRKHLDEEVDRLNKLYVALTRAREELYVISVRRDKPGHPSELFPQKGYGPRKRPGKVSPRTPRRQRAVAQLHRRQWKSIPTAGSVKIGAAETARGDFIHAVLANITLAQSDLASQVRRALDQVSLLSRETLPSGLLGEVEGYEALLVRFLKHGEIHPLFSDAPGRRVFNEQEFSDASGRLFRMDRVVVDSEMVTVVDFKTGGESDSYASQVRAYMALVGQIYPGKAVRGVLAYIDRLVVREIAAETSEHG
jgi:ATP-dependent helicase/nuclease subunit A